VDGSAVADVAEAVVHQEASTEQDGDAAVMSSGHDDALSSPKSSSAAMESEVIRDDNKEQNTTDVLEPQEHGTVGASALVENGHLCADMKADSFVAATEPDSQEDAAVESCRHDDALICTESGSADIESEVYGEDSKQEQSNAGVVEVEGQGVGRAEGPIANGHLCADTQADSSEATTEPENQANESKLTEVAESVEEDAASGEQDATDASQTNGHIYVALSADSCIVASESKAHSFETDGQETDQQEEEAPKTEAEVLEGVLKPTEGNCAGSVEELIGEEVDADGHASVEGTTDASGEQEANPMQVVGEATGGILEFEEVDMGKDGEEGLCDDSTVGKEKIDEAVPSVNVGESEEVTENISQDTMQGGLAKDGVYIGTIHIKPGSDPYVESSLEHKVKVEVDLVDEITAESDLKAENMVEVRTSHEVDEIEVKELAFADEANVAPLHPQQDCESVMETIEHEKVEAPGVSQPHKIDNSSKVELKKEFEMEVDDTVPFQEAAASVFHHEPRSIDLVENDSGNHSSPTTVLESCDHVQTEESRSQEISMTTVEQPICSASLEHGTMVVDEVEINSATGNVSKEKSSNVVVDQVEPVKLNADELVVVDDDQPSLDPSCESVSEIVKDSKSLENQSEICNASGMSDECSSRIANEGPSPINMSDECSSRIANNGSHNEPPHLTEEPCLSDKSCNTINYENGNEPDVVETKCMEGMQPLFSGCPFYFS
jgi:hypothetical protein